MRESHTRCVRLGMSALTERWARSLYQLLKIYLRPNLWNTFDGRPLRGCWARWIGTKEKNKESSWVKLKAFPTNIGRPNNNQKKKNGNSNSYNGAFINDHVEPPWVIIQNNALCAAAAAMWSSEDCGTIQLFQRDQLHQWLATQNTAVLWPTSVLYCAAWIYIPEHELTCT